jgi:protein SCO1/2
MGIIDKKNGDLPLAPGKDLEIVMLSIDPAETPALAADKKNEIINAMDPRGKSSLSRLLSGASGNLADEMNAHLHLLTGKEANILKETDAMGFKYYYNAATGVIRHPTGSVILTPRGEISSYTIGNDFPTRMLETGLSLAAANRISDHQADQSFMFGCIMLDPSTGKIRFVVENVVRILCILFLIGFGFGIYRMVRNERREILNGGGLSGLNRSS